jgi:two-component system chemotaxis sensor kinase CheA
MENNTTYEIDQELLTGFIDEAQEGLASLDNLFIKLETDPCSIDTINAIFRPIHTVKGNSAFFGLLKLKRLAHEMESLLMPAKEGKLLLNESIISVLLTGTDKLKEILSRARKGEPEITDDAAFEELIGKIIASRDAKKDLLVLWDELFDKFEKFKADFANLDASYVKQLEAAVDIAQKLKKGQLPPDSQTKPAAMPMPDNTPEPLRRLKSLLEKPGEDGLNESESREVPALLDAVKYLTKHKESNVLIEEAIGEYKRIEQTGAGGETLIMELLCEKIKKLSELEGWGQTEKAERKPQTAAPSAVPTPQPTATTPSCAAQEPAKTMRVAEKTIDNFLSYVGELIVVGKMYDYLQKNIAEKGSILHFVRDFRNVNETFETLSENLQKSIMEIRKVPVRTILQKAPRMVHDIAAASGKEIKVVLAGEGIEIDKRLVEILDGPLTHMVRNAADHGVETTAERLAAGKERAGTIRICVSDTKDDVTLTISDDGKGIDLEAIKSKGIKLGIIKPDQKLTQEQLIDLIFVSGVSTAQKVTEVSGRGVGMDVVRRNIDSANGKIIINTQQGKGTEFIIRLPKTVSTQIIDGFLVKVGKNSYVIPMDKVQEVFRPQSGDISTVKETNECVLRHNELLPVIRLSQVFGETDTGGDEEKIMVSTNILKRKMALCVDSALGVQKVVLKEFGKLDLTSEFYTAAAVMGNGDIAMVLDVDRIAGFAVKE